MLIGLKKLKLQGVAITSYHLHYILSHFPVLHNLSLLKLPNCHTSTFYDILKHRNDKCLKISLMDESDDNYHLLMPSEGIKEHAKTLTLDLLNKVTSTSEANDLMPQVMDMLCGGLCLLSSSSISCSICPYANLQTLTIKGLPIRSNNLHTLRTACPKLHSLTLEGLRIDVLFILFTLTSFPVDWPSLTCVHLLHAKASIECLTMILRCPFIADAAIFPDFASVVEGEDRGMDMWNQMLDYGMAAKDQGKSR